MLFHFASVFVFLIVSAIFIFGNLLIGSFVRPTRPTREKLTIYECGEPTIGSSWIRYNIRFYNICLFYLLFDVEVVVLFPAVVVLRQTGGIAFWAVLTFLVVLTIGLVYEWAKGALDWVGAEGEAGVAQAAATQAEGELQTLGMGGL